MAGAGEALAILNLIASAVTLSKAVIDILGNDKTPHREFSPLRASFDLFDR